MAYSLNLFLYHRYIVHISRACKAMNGMSLTAFDHGSVKNYSRELTRTDTWGSGVEYFYFMTHFGK